MIRNEQKINIATWFPTAIYETNLGESFLANNSLYYSKALEYKEKYEKKVDWKCDTYTTMDVVDLRDQSEFDTLLYEVETHVYNFAKTYGVTSRVLECAGAWVNIASPGEYQEYHTHPNNHFSAVYYVKAAENCGNIIFRSPDADNMFPLPVDTLTDFSYATAFYKPVESNLLIFRSNLWHLVCKNQSQEDRVSVAMNFVFN